MSTESYAPPGFGAITSSSARAIDNLNAGAPCGLQAAPTARDNAAKAGDRQTRARVTFPSGKSVVQPHADTPPGRLLPRAFSLLLACLREARGRTVAIGQASRSGSRAHFCGPGVCGRGGGAFFARARAGRSQRAAVLTGLARGTARRPLRAGGNRPIAIGAGCAARRRGSACAPGRRRSTI